jgi:hypothetical protein
MQIDNSICAWRRRSAYVGDIIFGAVGEIIGCPRTSGMAAGERGCGGAPVPLSTLARGLCLANSSALRPRLQFR